MQLDPGDNASSQPPSIDELRDASAARQDLPSSRPEFRHRAAAVNEREPQLGTSERLGHIPAIEQEEVEQPMVALAPYAEASGVEPTDDPAANVEDDDHADPQPHPDATDAERASGQEDERWMVARRSSAR
jgi:hypothetical protein